MSHNKPHIEIFLTGLKNIYHGVWPIYIRRRPALAKPASHNNIGKISLTLCFVLNLTQKKDIYCLVTKVVSKVIKVNIFNLFCMGPL